jgi:hypothetical protein
MSNLLYNQGLEEMATGAAALATADLRMLLLKSTYSPDRDHRFVADVVAGSQELSVGGYARQTLAGKTVTRDDALDRVVFDADDALFAGLAGGQTIGGAVLFRHTGNDATAPVLAFYDLPDTPTDGSNVPVQFAPPESGGALTFVGG